MKYEVYWHFIACFVAKFTVWPCSEELKNKVNIRKFGAVVSVIGSSFPNSVSLIPKI